MKTEIVCIIDRSGSMQAIRQDAIGGFNQFLEAQKAVPGEALFTLALFDHEYLLVQDAVPLDNANPMSNETFVPRGTTALLDAIGRTVNSIGARLHASQSKPDKVIVLILTDGAENASTEFSSAKIKEMIEHQQQKYAWEFVFLGANQDAITAGAAIGIPAHNTVQFAADAQGTADAYRSMSVMSTAYRTGAS